MLYIIVTTIFLIMAAAGFCGCFKPGKNDGICKYGQGGGEQ